MYQTFKQVGNLNYKGWRYTVDILACTAHFIPSLLYSNLEPKVLNFLTLPVDKTGFLHIYLFKFKQWGCTNETCLSSEG